MNQESPDVLAQKAIQAALKNQWTEAIELNLKIIGVDSKNIDALNRLAKAYQENGNPKKSQRIYREVLRIDSYNLIAKKNLKRFNQTTPASQKIQISPNLFLEEPGKTKAIFLKKIREKVLDELNVGEEVFLKPSKKKLAVNLRNGKTVGEFEENLGQHLSRLISGGNRYQIHVLSIEDDGVGIFIREIKRGAKINGVPSFPNQQNRKYLSSLKDGLLSLISDESEIEIENGEDDDYEEGFDEDKIDSDDGETETDIGNLDGETKEMAL